LRNGGKVKNMKTLNESFTDEEHTEMVASKSLMASKSWHDYILDISRAIPSLKAYLSGHEQDIADGIDDFGGLRFLFFVVFKRDAKEAKLE
jgi:hypothetical protein